MTKHCIQCGKNLPDDAKYCLECGSKQESPGSIFISIGHDSSGQMNVAQGDVYTGDIITGKDINRLIDCAYCQGTGKVPVSCEHCEGKRFIATIIYELYSWKTYDYQGCPFCGGKGNAQSNAQWTSKDLEMKAPWVILGSGKVNKPCPNCNGSGKVRI